MMQWDPQSWGIGVPPLGPPILTHACEGWPTCGCTECCGMDTWAEAARQAEAGKKMNWGGAPPTAEEKAGGEEADSLPQTRDAPGLGV